MRVVYEEQCTSQGCNTHSPFPQVPLVTLRSPTTSPSTARLPSSVRSARRPLSQSDSPQLVRCSQYCRLHDIGWQLVRCSQCSRVVWAVGKV